MLLQLRLVLIADFRPLHSCAMLASHAAHSSIRTFHPSGRRVGDVPGQDAAGHHPNLKTNLVMCTAVTRNDAKTLHGLKVTEEEYPDKYSHYL